MNSVERVKQLCKSKKIPISKLEKDLGYSNGYISQLRKGVFPSDRLVSIAEYLNVSTDYLITGIEVLKNPAVVEPINRKLAGEEGFMSILNDIYGHCEDISIEGKYFSNHYYSIGIGKTRYALEDADFRKNGEIIPELEKKYGYIQYNVE